MHSLTKAFTRSAFASSKIILKSSFSSNALIPALSILSRKKYNLNKKFGYFSSPSFSTSFSKSTVQQKYKEDLLKVQNHSKEETAQYQEIFDKYLTSKDYSEISQEETPLLLRSFFQLAKACYDARSRTSEAIEYYQEALNFAEKAGITENYVYYNEGKLSQVWTYLRNSEKIFEKLDLDVEAKYPYVQNIYLQGSLHMGKGEYDKALEKFTKALKFTTELPDSIASPLLIDTYEGMSYLYYKKQDLAHAHEFSKKCLNEIDDYYELEDIRTESLSRELALTLYQGGDFQSALQYAEKLCKILAKNYEKSNVKTMQSLILLGQIYFDLQNHIEEAQTVNKKWVRIYRFKENVLRKNEENIISRTGECFPWNHWKGGDCGTFTYLWCIEWPKLYPFMRIWEWQEYLPEPPPPPDMCHKMGRRKQELCS